MSLRPFSRSSVTTIPSSCPSLTRIAAWCDCAAARAARRQWAGAFGLWPLSLAIILPLGVIVFFTLGYASVTTMSVALFAIIVFAARAFLIGSPWIDVLYGVLAEVLLILGFATEHQKPAGWHRTRGAHQPAWAHESKTGSRKRHGAIT